MQTACVDTINKAERGNPFLFFLMDVFCGDFTLSCVSIVVQLKLIGLN